MPLVEGEGAESVFAIAALADCNPFVADRGMWMQRALGPAYIPFGPVWHAEGDAFLADPNAPLLRERAESLATRLRSRLVAGFRGSDAEYDAYRGLIFYLRRRLPRRSRGRSMRDTHSTPPLRRPGGGGPSGHLDRGFWRGGCPR